MHKNQSDHVYKIVDYAGNVLGNPGGYKTWKSANIALSRKYKKHGLLKYHLWGIYDDAKKRGYTGNLIFSIKQH